MYRERTIMQQLSSSAYSTLFTKPVMQHASKNVHISFACLILLLALCACTSSESTEAPVSTAKSTSDSNASSSTGPRPIALVYRGPAGCPGCSEALAALLQSSP